MNLSDIKLHFSDRFASKKYIELVDSMTAGNDLGLTDAVTALVTIHTDTRRRTTTTSSRPLGERRFSG